MSQQSLRQASIRAVTGTTGTYEGDWQALFTNDGIAAGHYNERLLAWINARLGTSYAEINGAMAALAADEGVDSFQALGTFDASGYSADATAYFAAMSVEPGAALKDAVDTLIASLKADGLWPLIDWLGLGPMHDEQAARVNLKNPAQIATVVGSPVFTAKQGYAGDNTAANLNSGIAGTTVTDTDASLFARVRTNGTAIKSISGYRSGRHELRIGGTSPAAARLVASTGSGSTTLSASGQFLCGSRTGTTTTLQVNTTIEDTDTVATDTLGNTGTIRFLGDGLTFSDAQLSYWGFGKHLDLTAATALRLHCNAFVTTAEAL